ncbi:MAG: 1-acyl-sn-glycerol-3-phosphate acyltransferase, partial [Pirellulales bacterium]
MHNVVIEKPYSFFPPHHGRIWPKLLQRTLRWRLRREHGIVEVKCHGIELLQQSLAAGHGVLMTPNHSRVSDPFVIGELGRQTGTLPFTMASWHLFMHSRLQTFL